MLAQPRERSHGDLDCGVGEKSRNFRAFCIFNKSGQQDLNLRPLGPQPSALPSYAIPREVSNDSIIADNFGFEKRFTSSFLFDIMIYDI